MIGSLRELVAVFEEHGVRRLLAKRLAPNDNSKNQIYLGGDFSSLQALPHGPVIQDSSSKSSSKQIRFKANLQLSWLSETGVNPAPSAQLILYPQYPEVRLSGVLKGCVNAPGGIVASRETGRVLFLGVKSNGEILAYIVAGSSKIAHEVNTQRHDECDGVFNVIPLQEYPATPTTLLLKELRRVCKLGWMPGSKLSRSGEKLPYTARNAGGYTLEAELGIQPNSYSMPDLLGWEIKQYSVTDFSTFRAKSPITLMTPEPTGGLYRELGVEHFIEKFGYPDQAGRPDRRNFGGAYRTGIPPNHLTGLKLELKGFDAERNVISDVNGGIVLLSSVDEVAASWSFTSLMTHWSKKHSKAVYVPSLQRNDDNYYRFACTVKLCQETDFIFFLRAVHSGDLFYDPAIKLDSTGIKRRSQFRIKQSKLDLLYRFSETVLLNEDSHYDI